MNAKVIAPCGFNCALCMAYQKKKSERGYCSGCNSNDSIKQAHCSNCILKNCQTIGSNDSGYCYECSKFPCRRLRQLDEKYKKSSDTSMIENLKYIQNYGIDAFLEEERTRWKCKNCAETVCIHRKRCLKCEQLF